MLELLNKDELGKLKKGLAAHYPFQGHINDITGNFGPVLHNTLTINPLNVQTTSGPFSLPDINLPNYLDYSLCFWIRQFTDADGNWSRNIIYRSPRTPGVWLWRTEDGFHFSSYVKYNTSESLVNVSTDVFGEGVGANNVWTHVILTCQYNPQNSVTTYQHFINGELRRRQSFGVIPTAPDGAMEFRFNAQWCDLRLYNRAVSESEARNIHALASRLSLA